MSFASVLPAFRAPSGSAVPAIQVAPAAVSGAPATPTRPLWLRRTVQTVQAGLMVIGLVALVGWQVNTFSQRPAKAGAAAQARSDKPQSPDPQAILDAIQPIGMAAMGRDKAAETVAVAVKPAEAQAVKVAMSAETKAKAAGSATAAEHKRIANHIARKYRVAADATVLLVDAAFVAGAAHKVDPLLILAVMAVESRYNPFAESPMGAQGLMQVIPKYHMDKFDDHGGKAAVLNPLANIDVGARIIREYVDRFGGLEVGLKRYSGASGESDNGYAAKVLGEKAELEAVKAGKAIPMPQWAVQPAAPALQPLNSVSPSAASDAAARDFVAPLDLPAPQPKAAAAVTPVVPAVTVAANQS
jgi:soluble lytic murein transglycosylase-like protein